MSFSADVKAELCRMIVRKRCCAISEAYGVLLFCNTFSTNCIKIVTESRDFSLRLPVLFRRAFSLDFDEIPEADATKLTFSIYQPQKLDEIFDTFGFDRSTNLAVHLNLSVLEDEGCVPSFIRGAFFAGGSVTNPDRHYHLELTTPHIKVGAEMYSLLLELGFAPKITSRNGTSTLYFKQSVAIEDFLTTIGAPVCAMTVMEKKVEKDMRNDVNRKCNCDNANLTKVVDAAQGQIAAIRALRRGGVLLRLPEKLQETARLRMDHPEATLTELAGMTKPPISKSAMNHRMRKIMELSRK